MTEEQYHDLNCHGNKLLITAVLDFIEAEMKRLYYNKYQKEMKSPYMNTDEDYSNSVFSVHAYEWRENAKPNFQYKDLKVWWNKYPHCGMVIEIDQPLTAEYLAEMLEQCLGALARDPFFGGKGDAE